MPTLIVLGASARAAAMSARRAGWQSYAIDQFADRDLAAIGPTVRIDRYPADFLRALTAAPPVPWLYTGGLENYPRVVDHLAEIRPLMGNRGLVLRAARDLRMLSQAAQEAGCKFPKTIQGKDIFGDESPVGRQPQWLLKRWRSSGGLHLQMLPGNELARPPRGYYQQTYIGGPPASAVFVAAGGRARLLGVTRQLLGIEFGLAKPFAYVGSVGPLIMTAADDAKLAALGDAIAERCHLVGLFNVDFIRTANDLWAIELNPRYSASIEVLERALEFRSIELHLAACQSCQLPQRAAQSAERFAGKVIVYAPRELIIGEPLEELIARLNSNRQAPLLADLPRLGERIARGSPVLTILVEAKSLADAETQLPVRLNEIQRALLS